jgi:Cytochrome b5-like Heme/Steroid binding domain
MAPNTAHHQPANSQGLWSFGERKNNMSVDWQSVLSLMAQTLISTQSLTGVNILVGCILFSLVAITIFRREISCNHCYADEKRSGSESSSRTSHSTSQSEAAMSWETASPGTDSSFLEAAGNCYSRAYYKAAFVLNILQMVLPKATVKALWKSVSSWWNLANEFQRLDEMLDGAELWSVYSPPPVINVVVPEHPAPDTLICFSSLFPVVKELPLDPTVLIFSFLHPKDVLTVASVNKHANEIVSNRNHEVSKALWKKLWYRDYAWVTTAWQVGRTALERSMEMWSRTDLMAEDASLSDVSFHRDFYFDFGIAYLDYVLAGQCTEKSCLVGLGGHIYDMTSFLGQHPGSRDTVLVNAGRDVSEEFEGIRHTFSARTRAQRLCVVVDTTLNGGCGLRPTEHCPLLSLSSLVETETVAAIIPEGRLRARKHSTLERALKRYQKGMLESQRRAKQISKTHDALDIRTYFDPFLNCWRAWYMDLDFEIVFLENFMQIDDD